MEKVKDVIYKGMAMVDIGQGIVMEKVKPIFLKKNDGAKGVLEEYGLTLICFVFLGIFLVFGEEIGEKIKTAISTKISSFLGGV